MVPQNLQAAVNLINCLVEQHTLQKPLVEVKTAKQVVGGFGVAKAADKSESEAEDEIHDPKLHRKWNLHKAPWFLHNQPH